MLTKLSYIYSSRPKIILIYLLTVLLKVPPSAQSLLQHSLRINELEYLDMPGLNVMLAHDFYPEGHQGGVGIIQNGQRIATNGDLRLEPTPGQWQPVPKVGTRAVDRKLNEISVRMEYPDPEKDRKGFNPVIYPDLKFAYHLRIHPEGKSFRIIVDLEQPLPQEWIGQVGFNLELYPGLLFGKTFVMDGQAGTFTRQLNGPMFRDAQGQYQVSPLAKGQKLTLAPEVEAQRMTITAIQGGALELLDGRAQHNNGWFVVRSLILNGASTRAIEWLVTPQTLPDFKSTPVIQVSQVGYHPAQPKVAMVELDAHDLTRYPLQLCQITADGQKIKLREQTAREWGQFLRYRYLQLDFSDLTAAGIYIIQYGPYASHPFRIDTDIFQRHVWQPTLEYFLPVQMCHMRVNDRYKVWHGLCHMDDARMAPLDSNHFDGYLQGPATLTKFKPGQTVPHLNQGGWHDAGDYDLRVESQSDEIYILSLAHENFHVTYDNTTINQQTHVVELHQPDGHADILQQIEHGALTIVRGYQALGRLYRGIIEPTLRQYVLLGDASVQTDNQFYQPKAGVKSPPVGQPGSADDRWVFTEENPGRELLVAAGLAAASRNLQNYRPVLAQECRQIAEALWIKTKEKEPLQRLKAAVELMITTGDKKYSDFLVSQQNLWVERIDRSGWLLGRVLTRINQPEFTTKVREAVQRYAQKIREQEQKTPYGVPYEPNIWGAGWGIQRFGVDQYFLHTGFPDIFPTTYMLAAMNFILGVHPGANTASFASGVGHKSLTVAYGTNRDEWYYIPGGVGSGTALIRPDFPELLEWPYLWQQTEYVLGGGASDFMFLVLAANDLLNRK